jgi:large subunit ribosomal protein L3
VGTTHAITVDDREKTPNFGKPLFNPATVLAVPDAQVTGVRVYTRENGSLRALSEVFSKELPKGLGVKSKENPEKFAEAWRGQLAKVNRVSALVSIAPRTAGLSQKKPVMLEICVGGGDVASQFDYAMNLLGKSIKFSEIFKAGSYVDVIAITKGKGYEGPVTRFGIKRKQHKSRKSVRAVGVIGPWHPAAVMYTVARAGQRGFHQRTEIGKRILMIADAKETPITPPGGFLHFGEVNSDYVLLRGSVPGVSRRFVVVRHPVREHPKKVTPPQIDSMLIDQYAQKLLKHAQEFSSAFLALFRDAVSNK